MRIGYLDCASGISGDMLLGALVDAGADLGILNEAIGSLGLPGCRLTAAEVKKKGFRALKVDVAYEPEHAHRHLHHIERLIDAGRLSEPARAAAKRVFRRLAEAEAKVHGTTVEKVHFHEVGAADSIADIVGAAVGLDLLKIDRLVASAVPTGVGRIRIAHGEVSVPAPATAELLAGIPLAASSVAAELTTPTGAAVLASLCEGFGPLPAMTIERIGYGAGGRDLDEQPNLLRLLVGSADAATTATADAVWLLETNLDDLSGEAVGHAIERLWQAGPLDVFTTAIGMKKNRPGVMLSVLCRQEQMAALETILFAETTTLGIRRTALERRVLPRAACTVDTPFGPIEGKVATLADGRRRFSPEYESCRAAALATGAALADVYAAATAAYKPGDL